MPTRSNKNGRSSKSSRHQSPRVNPSPLPAPPDPVATSTPPAVDLLVDFAASDPFGQDVGADQAIVGVFDAFDADAGHSRPSNSDEPSVPHSPSPQWNEARSSHPHDTQPVLDQPQPVLAQLNTFNLTTPSPALDLLDSVTADDSDDGDAIPIPVPRSQGSPVSSPVPTFPPRSPLIEVSSPHSYGYGHVSPRSPPTPASTPSAARPATLAWPAPTRFPPPASTISTTASPSSNRRFAAPLPFTRVEKESVAPPVVDLGTAGRGGGLLNRTGGDAERREKGEGWRGDEVVLWTRWDTIKTGSKSRRLLFIGTNISLQVWDCTLSPSPTEVLHVRPSNLVVDAKGEVESGIVVHAAVLPPPHEQRRGARRVEGDNEVTPLIGIAFDTGTFLMYSLKTLCVVRRVDVVDRGCRIEGFEANERFVIVSTTNPPSLHVLSSNTLDTLHVIGQDKVLPYLSPPTPAPSTSGSAAGLTTSTAVSMLSNAFAGALSGITSGSGPAALSHRPAYGEHSAYDEDTIYDDFTGSSTSHTLYNNNAMYNPHHVSLPPPGPRLGTVSPEFDHRRDHVQEHLHPHRPLSEHDRPHLPPHPPAHQHQHHHHAHHHEPPIHPHAIYALSHRLLAYASTTPSTSTSSTIPPGSQVSTSTSSSPGGAGSRNTMGLGMGSRIVGLPSTQAELGTAALRVGGSVLSGMRTLGGLAVSAARSRVGGAGGGGEGSTSRGGGGGSGVGRFFSRSAPEGVVAGAGWGRGREAEERERARGRERWSSNTSSSSGMGGTSPAYRHHANPTSEGGYSITVIDLAPLAGAPHASSPTVVAEFVVSKDKQITRLAFSSDGCTLIVVPRDGHTLQTFQIRPIPPFTPFVDTLNDDNRAKQHSGVGPPAKTSPPWHVYNLRRGRTSAVVEGVEWAGDGRWIAIGTRKRTVHVFGVNPYGGKTDQRSHLEGRVRNVDELQPMPMDLSPVVRLRGTAIPAVDQPRVPLSFTFIKSTDLTLPAHLLPQVVGPSAPSVASDASSSPPISPSHYRRRPTNFQDLLLFDPVDGTLSLRRFTVEMRPKEQGLVGSLGATSISLPGMGGTGRLSGSPSTSVGGAGHVRSSSKSRSGLAQTLEVPPMEMVAKENTVMTWNLRRRWDGVEVKKGLDGGEGVEDGGWWGRGDWLAQAELSTFSRSPKVLPRPIYLSHQFSFHTLGEDYHALIRRYKFDICGHKIDVHREVQISAYSAGSGESFVEGFSAPHDMRNRTLSSSFDEPLASALAGGLDHPQTSGILPMLPNGHPGSRPQSFRNAIPIRMTGLGDGMSDSLGRIRREINKVRSPRLKPRPDSGMSVSVPLEFDEEDEDFMSRAVLNVPRGDGGAVSRDTSRGDDGSGHTVSTPATSAHPLDDDDDAAKGDDAWSGWSSEDKLAIEEAERFDNIDVLGLLDEEQTRVVVPTAVGTKQKRKGRARQRQV